MILGIKWLCLEMNCQNNNTLRHLYKTTKTHNMGLHSFIFAPCLHRCHAHLHYNEYTWKKSTYVNYSTVKDLIDSYSSNEGIKYYEIHKDAGKYMPFLLPVEGKNTKINVYAIFSIKSTFSDL